MIHKVKITYKLINLKPVSGSYTINKELKIINFSKFK